MDLLKDLTRELRGGDDHTGANGRSRTTANVGGGSNRSESAGTSADSEPHSTPESSDRNRDDEHVCRFCQTEFDAERGTCPECDAEIVLRGDR